MKISKIFHWLYFTVMMLPCVIIPIFAIYTRNENYNSNIEVQVEQNAKIDFNQLVDNGNFENVYKWSQHGNTVTSFTVNQNIATIEVNSAWGGIYTSPQQQVYGGHQYLAFADISTNVNSQISMRVCGTHNWNNTTTTTTRYEARVTPSTDSYGVAIMQIVCNSNPCTIYVSNIVLYDLTQMGLENISTNDFNILYPSEYYAYTTSDIQWKENVSTITYNDTDVGSQFVYTLYNATDKYFNFDNFFGLDNVYSWIQLNWFSGNAPLGFAIFWHFFTYWLLASLAWLLFDLMVYVPLYIHRWLDKGAIE